METMINNYKVSCEMAKERISELLVQRRFLRSKGDTAAIRDLDLNRRIQLLYREYTDMKEIINHLEKIQCRNT